MTSLTYMSLNNYVMDTTTLSQSQTLLSQFLNYCDKSKTQPTSQSLSRFFQNSQPTQIQKPKPKITISTKKKQVIVIKKKENDYIVFTNNCRNNGFCVQEFQGKPAVFSDYINCPDSKLVVYISNINCTIIKYKFYNIVTPTKTIQCIIDYEINPLVEQQVEDYQDESDSEISLNIIQWHYQSKHYLVDVDTQEVFLNNLYIGIRCIQNQQFYIK